MFYDILAIIVCIAAAFWLVMTSPRNHKF
ncbi:membrane protein [Gordonia phage Spooky]|nr:membrane protein [Gordonia phage Spooky]UYL87927.1 hypothetical protein SEA_MALISHA_38 [Gordonia phage Malisha]